MRTQISAYISDETKENLERYSEVHSINKDFLIENAINYYIQVLASIPSEFIIPPNMVLSKEFFEKIMEMTENPPEPTQALIDLMRKDD